MISSDWSSDVCSSDLFTTAGIASTTSTIDRHCRSGGSRELWPPPLRRQGVRGRACEPLARVPTNARQLCWRAGRAGGGGLQEQAETVAPPPSLPLPSPGEGPREEPAAKAAHTGVGR